MHTFRKQRVGITIPVIEVAYERDPFCIGNPFTNADGVVRVNGVAELLVPVPGKHEFSERYH